MTFGKFVKFRDYEGMWHLYYATFTMKEGVAVMDRKDWDNIQKIRNKTA